MKLTVCSIAGLLAVASLTTAWAQPQADKATAAKQIFQEKRISMSDEQAGKLQQKYHMVQKAQYRKGVKINEAKATATDKQACLQACKRDAATPMQQKQRACDKAAQHKTQAAAPTHECPYHRDAPEWLNK